MTGHELAWKASDANMGIGEKGTLEVLNQPQRENSFQVLLLCSPLYNPEVFEQCS
jgi:hypothetical protein